MYLLGTNNTKSRVGYWLKEVVFEIYTNTCALRANSSLGSVGILCRFTSTAREIILLVALGPAPRTISKVIALGCASCNYFNYRISRNPITIYNSTQSSGVNLLSPAQLISNVILNSKSGIRY